MKKSHVSLLLIAAFVLGIFINKTYEIRQAHAATNRTLKTEMKKTRRAFEAEMKKTRACISFSGMFSAGLTNIAIAKLLGKSNSALKELYKVQKGLLQSTTRFCS